jgi:lipoate-protein ligase B
MIRRTLILLSRIAELTSNYACPAAPSSRAELFSKRAISWDAVAAARMARPMLSQATRVIKRKKFVIKRLGLLAYEEALGLQKTTEQAVRAGLQPDTLLLLEHPHTLTIGRRGDDSRILIRQDELDKRGVRLFETNRGGKITYHGLGQIVGYPIINLSPDREDVHRYVRDLEEVLILVMSNFGIEAFRKEGLTGVHTSRGKVAAIGVHIARWVTTHGFALNVNTDLSFFNLIVACEGEPVASMKELLGHEVELSNVENRIIKHFADVFEMEPDQSNRELSEFAEAHSRSN